jgi:hypothetical protein
MIAALARLLLHQIVTSKFAAEVHPRAPLTRWGCVNYRSYEGTELADLLQRRTNPLITWPDKYSALSSAVAGRACSQCVIGPGLGLGAQSRRYARFRCRFP